MLFKYRTFLFYLVLYETLLNIYFVHPKPSRLFQFRITHYVRGQKLCHQIAAELNEKSSGPQTFQTYKHYVLFCHTMFLYPVGMKHTNVEHY